MALHPRHPRSGHSGCVGTEPDNCNACVPLPGGINVKKCDNAIACCFLQALKIAVTPLLSVSEGVSPKWKHLRLQNRHGLALLFLWLPCGTLLSAAFTSNLLASLVAVETERPVDTFEQLVQRGEMIAMLRSTLLIRLMKESPREIVRRAHKVSSICYYSCLFVCLFVCLLWSHCQSSQFFT